MRTQLLKYLDVKFPNLNHEIFLRYELGEPFENGTDERLEQVAFRVISLFESIFKKEDRIHLLIKDWRSEDSMFGNTTPDYLYTLLGHSFLESEMITEFEDDENLDGNRVLIEHQYRQSILESDVKDVDYQSILKGIANYEQGREPSIGQSVYFIDMERDIIFNMYDDRGCIIFSNSTETIRHLYERFSDWIVEYWRPSIDATFKR